ncbi:MAG: glyoxalase [Acidimicrobiales bacterium]|nr:glyoxalase [Acidimicrobiales bacterium]
MTIGLWQTIRCRDADAVIAWLTAIGFTEHAVYRDEKDESLIVHAELLWPGGGGVMLGSMRDSGEWKRDPGSAGTYLVTEDPDGVYAKALAAGAEGVQEPRDEDYGGRGAAVRDLEGNLWSFGSYAPV